MNRKSLIATIKSNCSELLLNGKNSDGQSCKYLPIFLKDESGGFVAITENGYWCSVYNGKIREVTGPDHNRILFTLLEVPLKEIISKIKEGLTVKGLPEKAIITFPFDDLLIASLQTSWADLGLTWVDQGYPINDEIRLVLCNNDKQSKMWVKYQQERLSSVLHI